MRDHSTRGYNKKKVTRYRTKSKFKADKPLAVARFKYNQPLARPKEYSNAA
jgi:hypothetical protein